jgi:CheY-like chemotaxis protein
MSNVQPSILLVDDEESLRESMILVLELEGYTAQAVSSGQEALETIGHTPPDLIILDLSLPDISGWDVLHMLRDDPSRADVPVLILTAYSDEDTQRRALNEKVDGLLVKPADVPELLRAIERALG